MRRSLICADIARVYALALAERMQIIVCDADR